MLRVSTAKFAVDGIRLSETLILTSQIPTAILHENSIFCRRKQPRETTRYMSAALQLQSGFAVLQL